MPQEMKSYCKNVLNFMGHYYTQEGGESEGHQEAGLATNSFFLFPFCKISLSNCMTPRRRNTFLFHSSQQPTHLCLEHLKGFFG